LKILDCTLRDGGYYNNWDFQPHIVEAYLNAVAASGIEFVELGLRNFPKPCFWGAFAYTTEDFLNNLELPKGPTYGVMVDAKTILTADMSNIEAVDRLFVAQGESKIGLVRIAAHYKEIPECGEFAKYLKKLGYKVGFNLMQSGGKSENVISQAVQTIEDWDAVDVVYFADSLGNMGSEEVKRITKIILASWGKEVGIHTHNNMGRALDNTLTANELGVSWLDVTVTGMGRGAGNAQTESLLATLDKQNDFYNPSPIYSLVVKYFATMQKDYGWGSNLLYFIGAQNDVHPTYIQNLLSDVRFGPEEVVSGISYLSETDCSSYDGEVLEKALNLNSSSDMSGSENLNGKFKGRKVLLIGNGESVNCHSKAIISYINKHNPIVVSINITPYIPEDLIDFYVISHNSKYLADKTKYSDLNSEVVLPFHRFAKEEVDGIKYPLDFGLSVLKDTFKVTGINCFIPSENTAAFALAIAIAGGCNKILVVGLDGYERGDQRQPEMTNVILHFTNSYPDVKLLSLTPSSYPLDKGSIYAPFE
jgi:4-hydroxy 2-oxovalerate aldolase